MNAVLRVIVFDVEHGSCAFLRTPSGHGILIDCGRRSAFSPVKYLLQHETSRLTTHLGYTLTELIVSHPHDDHIEDIDNLTRYLPPAMLDRQVYNWDEVKTDPEADYDNLDVYAVWERTYRTLATEPPLGLTLDKSNYLRPDEARLINESRFINNSSIPVVVSYQGPKYQWKFLFAADLEVDGWQALLKRRAFREAIYGTDFFVTAHHGHTSGYCKEVFDAFGSRPILNIVSAHKRDESVEPAYSREECAQGWPSAGEARRMLSTRHDGSIVIDILDTDQYRIESTHLEDNDPPS